MVHIRIIFACGVVLFISPVNGDEYHHKVKLGQNATSNCSELEVDHIGYQAPQIEGHVLLKQENQTVSTPDSEGTINSTESELNKTCVVPHVSDGKQYNWWQVLLQNGGRPGSLKELQRKNTSIPEEYLDPCRRPLSLNSDDEDEDDFFFAYEYESSDFKTVYRTEKVRRLFTDTPQEFLEVSGEVVWIPPPELKDQRGYNVEYVLDDSGFWVMVQDRHCTFGVEDEKPSLECSPIPKCDCKNGELECSLIILPTVNGAKYSHSRNENSNCPKLEVYHRDYESTQIEGHVLLKQEDETEMPT